MKNLFTILFLFLALSAQAQVRQDAQGNYHAVKTEQKAEPTGKTFTDAKGNVYPVMKSAKGKLFIVRTSEKTGKTYNQYLKIN